MEQYRRTRNYLVLPLSCALAIVALIYGCTFPSANTPIPATQPSSEGTEDASPSTPSILEPPPSSATPTLPPPDQEQTVVDLANETGIGGSVQQKLAQVFTVNQDGYISHLALPLNCQPTAWLLIRIEDVSSGAPGGGVLGSQVVLGSELVRYQSGLYTSFPIIAFENPLPVSAGTSYAFTLETIAGDCSLHWGQPGDTYPGGRAYFQASDNPPGWWAITDPERDLAFQIFISDNPGNE